MITYIGVDPGVNGGVGVLQCSGSDVQNVESISLSSMPPQDVYEWIRGCRVVDGKLREYRGGKVYGVIEKVGGYVPRGGDEEETGRNRQPGSHMFAFGASYGRLEGFLIASGIPYTEVEPRRWLSSYNIQRDKEESDSAWKGRLKRVAQNLFPQHKITLGTSDALLLAEYCRRLHNGLVSSTISTRRSRGRIKK